MIVGSMFSPIFRSVPFFLHHILGVFGLAYVVHFDVAWMSAATMVTEMSTPLFSLRRLLSKSGTQLLMICHSSDFSSSFRTQKSSYFPHYNWSFRSCFLCHTYPISRISLLEGALHPPRRACGDVGLVSLFHPLPRQHHDGDPQHCLVLSDDPRRYGPLF